MSNRILVNTGDSRIWDAEIAMAKIVFALSKYGSVVIDFQKEAPDIATTELKKVLDYLCDQGVKHDQIEIHTGNIVESYDKFRIVRQPQCMYELPMFQKLAPHISKQKQIQKHFGCFIGRSNIIRLIMASHLYSNYKDKTLLSYHFEPGTDFHRMHLGLENIIYYFGINSSEYKEAIQLLDQGPIKLTDETVYPISNRRSIDEPCQWYKNIFVDIVCETFSNGNVFFLTEKFWRPIATKTPFILQGPQFTLQRLKKLGFKTFDKWWDEGYDQDPYLYSQNEIKKVLLSLGQLSIEELTNMHNDMQSVLDHNYERMMTLRFKDFDVIS